MQQTTQKKKKKQQQITIVQTEEISESGQELVEFLEKLEEEKTYFDVQACPKCKSPKVKRTGTSQGDVFGHMALVPPKYECSECGWNGQTIVKVTNRPLTVRDVELIAEALDATDE